MKPPSRRWVRWGALALAVLVAGLVAVVAALPSLIRWGLRRGVEQVTGMRASVGEVVLNRRTGEARIGELRVTHPRSGKPVAGWNGITGRIRYAPLLLGTLRFNELTFDRPFVALARGGDRPDGDAIPLSVFAGQGSESSLTPALDLQRLQITQGRISLFDAVGEGRTVRVEDLNVRVSDFATRGGEAGRQTSLEVSARWEGGRFEVSGWVRPFAQPPEGDLALRVVDLDLSLVDALLFAARGSGRAGAGVAGGPGSLDLPLMVRGGRADATAHLARGATGGAQAVGTLELRQPAVELAEGRGHASAQGIKVAVGGFDLATFTLHDGRIGVQGLEGDLGALGGIAGRVASAQATVGSFDVLKRSARSMTVEVTGLTARRDPDATALEGGRLRLAAEALELPNRSGRGITVEAEGLALRGVGGKGSAGALGSLRASADALDLAARSGSGLKLQAARAAASGLGAQPLSGEVRSLQASAEGVAPGARALRGVSLSLEGVSATGPRGPLGTIGAVRAAAATLDLGGRSGTGIRVEAEQAAVAGLGPQAISGGLRAVRAAADGVDLSARAARGASLAVEWLAASRAGEAEPFVVVRGVRLEAPRVDLSAPAVEVARLVLDAPTIQVRRDAAGLDLARLLPPPGVTAGSPAPSPGGGGEGQAPAADAGGAPAPGAPVRTPGIPLAALAVGLAQVGEGAVTFTDATVSPAVQVAVRDIAVNLLNVRPGGGVPATLVASAKVGRAGSFQLGAQFTPGTLRDANGTARLEGIDVDVARPYLRLPAPFAAITGRVTAEAEARPAAPPAASPPGAGEVTPAWKVVARVEGRELAGRDRGGRALAEVPSLDLKDIEVTVPDLTAAVREVAVTGFKIPVERDAAGVVRIAGMPLSALRSRSSPSPNPQSAIGNPQSPSGGVPPMRVRSARLSGSIPLVDRARAYPLETGITDLVLELSEVGTVGANPMGLRLSGKLEEMTFAGAGSTRFGPLQGQASLEVKDLDVVRWADYLPDPIRGRLADLRGQARLEAAFGAALADLVIRGQVDAAPLQLADDEGNALLGVERAQIAIERLTLAPLSLHVRSVLLDQPWVNVERRPDGRINVLDLLPSAAAAASGDGAPAAAGAPAPVAAARAEGGKNASMPITIDRITVQNGIFDVADRKMTPAFQEQLKAVAVRVDGISPNGSAAPFDLAGRFSDNATLSLKGTAAPRVDQASLELDLRLADFNLSGLSTYVKSLTSHRLERGKLTLEAHYRLQERQLEGVNRIRVDQLGVGEAEEWPDKFTDQVGVSLPFAVSLLQDSDGVIEIEVPVHGDVTHPEFDLGEVIRTAIQNAVVATITAPFRWIGQIFQSAGRIEEIRIDPVLFEPGSDELGAAGKEAVGRLVAFLKEAPAARLQIVGFAEPEQDGKALLARGPAQPAGGTGVIRRLAQRLGLARPAPAAPPAADLDALARRRALAVYEALLRAEADPQRLFLGEGLVEAVAQAKEREMPPQGRVELRLLHH